MNLFELERLRREGKDVILVDGVQARRVAEKEMFDGADLELDLYFIRKRQERDLETIRRNEESKCQNP